MSKVVCPLPTPPLSVSNPKSTSMQQEILQTTRVTLELPKADEVWSTWYRETDDQFMDFQSFGVTETGINAPLGTATTAGGNSAPRSSSHRTLSARRISGQFEEEVMKSWEEDWEDEDVEDTFDAVMGQIGRHEASRAAASMSK